MNQRFQLHLGDCLRVLPTIDAGSVNAVIADLPYGTTNNGWDLVIPLEPLWREFKRVIKRNGAIVLFGSQPFTSQLVMSNPKQFRWEDIWHKTQPTGFLNAMVMPLRQHENVLVFGDGRIKYNPQFSRKPVWNIRKRSGEKGQKRTDCYNKFEARPIDDDDTAYPRSVMVFKNPNHGEKGLHPTQKPVDLLKYLVLTYTNPGDTVLDCTMGSGTTGVAAVQLGRKFIGIELDETYFNISLRRITDASRAADGLPKQLAGHAADLDGLPMFAEVAG